jgi:sortase A
VRHKAEGRISRSGILRWIQFLLLGIGIILLLIYAGLRIRRYYSVRQAVERFNAVQETYRDKKGNSAAMTVKGEIDFSLWSDKRIKAFQKSLLENTDPPLGILRVPKIKLEVPVYAGTDDQTLDLGVGWIDGTAKPGQPGNIGLAGHRDGFFRGLKDVVTGDQMDLLLPDRTDQYVVDRIVIVTPEDVSVLNPRPQSSVTLVTCYPFYFVGSAPQRYIVQASIAHN